MSFWIGIALLGGVGAVLRAESERHLRHGLMAVNTIGCFVIGLLHDPHGVVAVGLLGGLTSFSGWTARPKAEAAAGLALGLGACALARAL